MLGRLAASILLVSLVAVPAPALARQQTCSCTPADDEEAFANATAVFEGRAIAPVELVIPDGSEPADGWSFVVTGVAKGQVGPEQLVAVPTDSHPCTVDFEREQSYLILANDDRADLPAAVVSVDSCSGTRPAVASFGVDIVFRDPQPIPIDTDSFPVVDPLAQRAQGDKLTQRAVVGIGAIIGLTTALAVWLWRSRPNS